MTRLVLLLSVVSLIACGGEPEVEVAPVVAAPAPATPAATAPVAAAAATGALCTNTCASANDGDCDDGGENSEYDICALGSDCVDCGPRSATDAPAAPAAGTAGCSNTCESAGDGECDDGGPGSEYDVCAIGTDCTDCGAR